jgi:glycosyltransferase involved in cell wall biosynthesis
MIVENLSVPADPRVWLEARTLREHGYQVCIICPQGENRDTTPYDFIEGVHIYRYTLPAGGTTSLHYVKEYGLAMLKTLGLSFKLWRRHGFDVIHAANPPDTCFAIGLLYKLFGKKYIFDQHDLAPEVFRARFPGRIKHLGPLLTFLEMCSYRAADVVITTNNSQRARAIHRGGCRPEKVFVVRNGPDLRAFRQMTPEPGLKRGRRYLLAYIGVMGVQDGVDYALRALHELVYDRGRQDVSLVLMGDGDQLAALKTLAHDLELDSHVTFTGWVGREDLLRYLTVTDIGLTPDPSNALNDRSTMLKTMEYMAMGKPLVAFDTPETRYSAEEAALYATPNLVADFADKIETLLDDEDLRLRMGAYGRRRVEHELCWDRTKVHLRLAYDTLF